MTRRIVVIKPTPPELDKPRQPPNLVGGEVWMSSDYSGLIAIGRIKPLAHGVNSMPLR